VQERHLQRGGLGQMALQQEPHLPELGEDQGLLAGVQ
jgi:hypothetical protein